MPWEPNRLSPCHGQKDGYRHTMCPGDKPVCKQWVCSVDKDFLERQADLRAEPEPILETQKKTCGRQSAQNKYEVVDKGTRGKKTCGRQSVQNKYEVVDKGTRRKKTCGRQSAQKRPIAGMKSNCKQRRKSKKKRSKKRKRSSRKSKTKRRRR